jgi:hypothetical protein
MGKDTNNWDKGGKKQQTSKDMIKYRNLDMCALPPIFLIT